MSLAERADRLRRDGRYPFKSARGSVLYVGKAQNLRSRVKQYVLGGDGRITIPKLLDRALDVDVVVTPSVKDALLLENELIKRHKPPFNVGCATTSSIWRCGSTARDVGAPARGAPVRDDGAEYFGPYTSSIAMHEALSTCGGSSAAVVQRGHVQGLRGRGRPCIEFEMKRCLAPCCGPVDIAAYGDLVSGTALFLRGKSRSS